MNNEFKNIKLFTTDNLFNEKIKVKVDTFIHVTHTETSNVVNDVREKLKNLTGGQMKHYENLIEKSIKKAKDKFKVKLLEMNFDGALSVKISHPSVVDGGCEVVIYGTPYKILK